MSLTLLPAVDVRDGKAVRLRQGESGSETDYGSPLEAARTWAEAGAEWIHLVDLDAAFGTGNNRAQLREIVHELGDKVNIEMSGGVRDDDSLSAALEAGAARVNIGTAALENPEWTASVIKRYGDRVAIGLDVRGHTLAARGWVKEGGDLFETMKFLDSVGCSRYVVTDVARDGMMSGPNIDLLREVAERTDNHAVKLGVFVDEALDFLDSHGLPLEAVAVSCGPGSYTGLRIGVSMAKGICYGRGVKLIAVPTLDLMAVPVLLGEHPEQEDALIVPMLDARRMEVYAEVLDRSLKVVRPIQADIVDAETYKEYLDGHHVYFFGNGAAKCMETINHPHAHLVEGIEPLAKNMAPLAEKRFVEGKFEDVAYFVPFYLKDFVAKMPKKLI